MIWISLSSLVGSANHIYSFNSYESQFWMNILAASGPLMTLLFTIPMTVILNRSGLRVVLLIGISLTFSGSLLRLPATDSSFLYLLVLAQFLNASAYPFVFSSTSRLAAVWFPIQEQGFATAMGALAQNFGSTLAYALAVIVRSINDEAVSLIRIYQIEAMLSGITFVAMFFLFKKDPSLKSEMELEELSTSRQKTRLLMFICLSDRKFVLSALASSISVSLWIQWTSSFELILGPQGIKDTSSSTIAFVSTLVGIIGGIIGNGFIHVDKSPLELILAVSSMIASGAGLWFEFASLSADIMPLYISSCIVGVSSGIAFPLMYQHAAHITSPLPEGISSGILTIFTNILFSVFLLVFALSSTTETVLSIMHSIAWLFAGILYLFLWRAKAGISI